MINEYQQVTSRNRGFRHPHDFWNPTAHELPEDEAANVVLVVEITSPGNAVVDRAVKPQLYALAEIPHYLRTGQEETGPGAVVHQLKNDCYVETARVGPDHPRC